MKEHVIAAADADIRLDRWFKRHFPSLNHGGLEKALRKGEIRVNGKKAKASDRTVEGQKIAVHFQIPEGIREKAKTETSILKPEDVEMMQRAVLYKDNDVIVINKPAGLAVQGGSKITRSVDGMLDALSFGAARPKLVHRLDRDTSGVLVLARSAAAATRLMKAFSGKKPEKIYWALINGVPQEAEGKIDLPLSKDEGDYEKVGVDDEGKRAVTYYRVVERVGKALCWVELKPLTGRTHQLRVHMNAIGHPVIGDGKYGGRAAFLRGMEISQKLHLHARRIVIPGMLDVTAPLPKHMEESFKTLGLDQ